MKVGAVACVVAVASAGASFASAAGHTPGFRVLWRTQIEADYLQPYLAADGKDVYITGGRTVSILDASSGRVTGTFRPAVSEDLSSPVVVKAGLATVAGGKGLFLFDRHGRQVWRYAFGTSILEAEFPAGQAPLLGPGGIVFAAGPDGRLHAVRSETGKGVWSIDVGYYEGAAPAILLGVGARVLFLDARSTRKDLPTLTGVRLAGDTPATRMSPLGLGRDVSSFAADPGFGVVASNYVEVRSKQGTSRIVCFDDDGQRRWTVERGRHESVLAINPKLEMVSTSRDKDGNDPGSTLDWWTRDGVLKASHYLPGNITQAVVGHDSVVFVTYCTSAATFVQSFGPNRSPVAQVQIAGGCARSATLDQRGRLFLVRPGYSAAGPSAEVVAIQTHNPAATIGWVTARGDSASTGCFSKSQ